MNIKADELNKAELAEAYDIARRSAKLKQVQLYNEELETTQLMLEEMRALVERLDADELIVLSQAAVNIAKVLQSPL